ncbi:MAG: hypothetical protein U0636_01290 [Phycisphaerales bacterium]
MSRLWSVAVACVASWCATVVADGPAPFRNLAPDTTYIMVSADTWSKAVEAWEKTGLSGLMNTDAMQKVLGKDGARGSMEKHLKELGVPEGSVSWPDAFGAAMYAVHNTELDTDESNMVFYGDWGTRADAMSKVVDALMNEAVKEDKWKLETGDQIAGRDVITIVLPESERDKALRERFGQGLRVEVGRRTEKLFYVRDGARFLMGTDRGGLEDVLEALDGKRKCKVPEQKEFQGAMDQLGQQDLSVIVLTAPMQGVVDAAGGGMMAAFQPMVQLFLGDVQAWSMGMHLMGSQGQVEISASALLPGAPTGVWKLLGPAAPVDKPPAVVGGDAVSFYRMNVQFKEVMTLINTMAANLPAEMGGGKGGEMDAWLLNYGPVVSKGFEAMGPHVWSTSVVRQPVTPESKVGCTVVECTNPKAVVPMVAQMGAMVGMKPRDVDGNTLFSSEMVPMTVGISNGYMAMGDSKQVEQVMRAVGQKDLPMLADHATFKQASGSVGSQDVLGWGYTDIVASWKYDHEMLKAMPDESGDMEKYLEESDDSPWAKRMGYQLPDNTSELLKALEPDVVAKYLGPMVWTLRSSDKGFTVKLWLMSAPGQ